MFVICIVSSHVFTSHYFYHIFGFLLTFLTFFFLLLFCLSHLALFNLFNFNRSLFFFLCHKFTPESEIWCFVCSSLMMWRSRSLISILMINSQIKQVRLLSCLAQCEVHGEENWNYWSVTDHMCKLHTFSIGECLWYFLNSICLRVGLGWNT